MGTFQLVLGIGVSAIVGLAIVGVYPVAFAAALVLVPLMMVLYMWDIDVYEDEPLRVIGYTAGWGIVTGLIAGLLIRAFVPLDIGAFGSISTETLLVRGVVIPLLGGAVMLAGPLVLLPYRKFNDVLDGATFGATAAVTFVAAQSFAQAVDLFAGGIRPAGDPLPWVVRLVALGIANPVIAAGAIGSAAGALWLRHRAPIADRNRLGLVGRPVVAIVGAALLLVGSRGWPARAAVRRRPGLARAPGGDRDDLAAGGDPSRAAPGGGRARHRRRDPLPELHAPDAVPQLLRPLRDLVSRPPQDGPAAPPRAHRLRRPDARVTTATRPPGRSPFRVLLTFVVALGVVLLVASAVAVALTPAAPPPDCPDPTRCADGRPRTRRCRRHRRSRWHRLSRASPVSRYRPRRPPRSRPRRRPRCPRRPRPP